MLPTKFQFISAERFQRRRLKCEKLTDDGRQKLTLSLEKSAKKCLIKSEMVPCLTLQNSLLSTNYLTQSELVLSSTLHTKKCIYCPQNA